MSIRRIVVAAAVLLTGVACSGSSKSSTPATPLSVTVSAARVQANGANTVTVHVAQAASGTVSVSASKGTFAGAKNATLQGPAGDLILTTCDASSDTTCAGVVTLTATDSALVSASAQVTFSGAEVCNNNLDDNGDGLIDCQDSVCDAKACRTVGGVAGACQALTCVVPVCTPIAASPETNCADGLDNDCNGSIDCADAPCDGQSCKAGAPTFRCQNKSCVDLGSGYGLAITPARVRIPADGVSTTSVVVKATNGGTPAANATVNLSTTAGAVTATVQTDTTGAATAVLTSDKNGGVAVITATLAAAPIVSMTATVAMPLLGTITVVPVTTPVLGVKYSGFNEQIPISVLLLDTNQQPYPDGLAVRFEHQQLGGSEISKPFAPDTSACLAANHCIGYLGATSSTKSGKADSEGLASVNLYSGTAAGPVSIKVTAVAGGLTRSYAIQNLAVVGAKASGARVSIDCSPKNVPAFQIDDCTNSYYTGPGSNISCVARFADRFGNVLGTPTLASFLSEAGAAGQPVLTGAYDPTKGIDQAANLGFAKNTIEVAGYPIPAIVTPLAGEPRYGTASDRCGVATRNPRDGLVSIVVMAPGEEGFVDLNANGVWDPGEPFIDQGEPFVDVNDDGIWESGEPFYDANFNGVYDGPNGRWDSNTVVWAETRVLYTSLPAAQGNVLSHWLPGSFAVTVAQTGPPAVVAKSDELLAIFADENMNPISPTAAYSVSSLLSVVTTKILQTPNAVDNLGMDFTQQYCDKAPPATPTVCSNVCPSAPCYRVTTTSNFAGGIPVDVLMTPGTVVGPDTVEATCTLNNISWSMPVSGAAN